MAGMVVEAYGQPLNFSGLEGPLVELRDWSFAEILLLNHIEGTPCQMGDLRFIELKNSIGDKATLVETFKPGVVELVHTRELKPWVRPENPLIKAAIKKVCVDFPGIFAFMVDQETRKVNISSLIDLERTPLPISAECLKLRWSLAAKIYRTGLAGVVTPFRHIRQS